MLHQFKNKRLLSVLVLLIILILPATALAAEQEGIEDIYVGDFEDYLESSDYSVCYSNKPTCVHNFKVIKFNDEGIANIRCSYCGLTYSDNFIDHVNTQKGDDMFDVALDLNADGYINAKDFYLLIRNSYSSGSGDNNDFVVIDYDLLLNNVSDIKTLLIMVIVALGIDIGSTFLRHFSFWKW